MSFTGKRLSDLQGMDLFDGSCGPGAQLSHFVAATV